MKINFTLFGAGLTGGSFNLLEPAQRLAKRGHNVSITTIGQPGDMSWFESREKPLFQQIFTPVVGSFAYRVYRRLLRPTVLHPFPDVEIKDLIRSIPECDINIATSAPTTFAVHRAGRGRGFYYAQHYDSLFGRDGLQNRIHNESYFLPLTKIAVASWLKNKVEEELKVSMPYVITAGIDEKVFQPAEDLRPKDKIRIISLGRKVDWKGFEELRSAMRDLMKERKDVEWTVFSSRDTPENSVDAPFTLHHSPYGRDLAALYSSAHICVNPSWHEGFSQPALEAMSCGCAVITTPIGAEDFIEDGKNCLVVPAKNPDAIRMALRRLCEDSVLRERLSRGAIETAQRFYWDRIIDKWEKVLTDKS
jgi:glycosyltransferase involved in cell wall biosynthesis